ncbi:hypothetical protein H1V43_32245 [Streptomyces sp. PSKA54]|uniref:Uncharacterized protein n=1 Tax=Streptomyces himalayensis subsp. aureolus TaxID=2758039 RepID=A0A7W2HJB8_9ACTN|nr:hypothetical protein [Streptomyces himalayensis]MBA4865936.1 hypothetical protein [Streptomyces himalayensis subsp. aureolus]
MSGTTPGADELRMRHILRRRGVGPDAEAPTMPTTPEAEPAPDPDDWWDRLYADDEPKTEPEPHQAPRRSDSWRAKPAADEDDEPDEDDDEDETDDEAHDETPARKPKRRTRKQPSRRSPRQSLLDTWDRTPPRLKWLAYHGSAAYMGWELSLVNWSTYVTAWIADTGLISVQACVWYGIGLATVALYRRAGRWWWPVAWLASIPASSAVVGVLLYAPNSQGILP